MKKNIKNKKKHIPLSVPSTKQKKYLENFETITEGTGNLFLFAGDQKIEHLNEDFYGPGISKVSTDPIHLFEIASKARIGAFATHLGMIAHYGGDFKSINYIVKLNGKTNLVSTDQQDPISLLFTSVEDVVTFQKQTKLSIAGVGYTVYLGSEYEDEMLCEAAEVITQAHREGLLAILWIYPRGKAVKNEHSAKIIAGAAGVAVSLGADFVKVNPPHAQTAKQRTELLKQATMAAGRTGVICSGGAKKDSNLFLEELSLQMNSALARGSAVGRNIHQKPLEQAIKFCDAIAAIIFDGNSLEKAKKFLD